MSVYVDSLEATPPTSKEKWPWPTYCHMVADTADELEAMARRLGLKLAWRQSGTLLHYDLTASKRTLAIELGAISISPRLMAERVREARRQVGEKRRG